MNYAGTADGFFPYRGRQPVVTGTQPRRQVSTAIKATNSITAEIHRMAQMGAWMERTVINAPYLETWRRVRLFAGLQPGWKGPESIPVTAQAIQDAEDFTRIVVSSTSRAPTFIGAASDGELIINWQHPDKFVEASFHGNGTYSYYAKIGGAEYFGDDIPAEHSLPDALIGHLET